MTATVPGERSYGLNLVCRLMSFTAVSVLAAAQQRASAAAKPPQGRGGDLIHA